MSPSGRTESAVSYLLPKTVTETSGESDPYQLGELAGKPLLVVLRVTDIIEQESLHASVWGSIDGKEWGSKALFWFPQRFYRGATPAAIDLSQHPEVKFFKARWELNRWGRGYPVPRFEFSLEIQRLERKQSTDYNSDE
jgi:hypothetical protein